MTNQKPRGGTELQLEYLHKYVDKFTLDKVQITTSIPEKDPQQPGKPQILWQKNSYDQPNLAPWFSDKSNHSKYDWYVFNSHWNFEKFTQKFGLPTEKCVVIKNGIDNIEPRDLNYEKGKPIKIIHQCTPWRGLSVLLGAMQLIRNPLISLDVYSSCEVYGSDFAKQNDKEYEDLYNQARNLPNVNYIGYKSNEYIKEHLKDYHIFAYPSIWEETFCISALEAMAAGLYCVTTNYGALYETCAEFPMYVPYSTNYYNLARKFAYGIQGAAEALKTDTIKEHLKLQIEYTNKYYNWTKQGASWTRILQGVAGGQ